MATIVFFSSSHYLFISQEKPHPNPTDSGVDDFNWSGFYCDKFIEPKTILPNLVNVSTTLEESVATLTNFFTDFTIESTSSLVIVQPSLPIKCCSGAKKEERWIFQVSETTEENEIWKKTSCSFTSSRTRIPLSQLINL